jgi:hypothetical protein
MIRYGNGHDEANLISLAISIDGRQETVYKITAVFSRTSLR